MGQLGGTTLGAVGLGDPSGGDLLAIGEGLEGSPDGGGFVFQDIERIVAISNTVFDTDKRIIFTDDGGLTWTAVVDPTGEFPFGIAYSAAEQLFMIVANNGAVAVSQDAVNWTEIDSGFSQLWRSVAYSPTLSRWVAVASTGTQRVMFSDDNGATWTLADSSDNAEGWTGIVWHETDEKFFAGAILDAETIMSSTDGITWLAGTTVVNSASLQHAVDQPSGRVIYMGAGSRINFIDNTESATPTTQQTVGDNGFIGAKNAPAVNADGSIWMGAQSDSVYTSANGSTGWAISVPASGGVMRHAKWSVDFSRFVGLAAVDDGFTSDDADQWTARTLPTGADGVSWNDMVVGRV